MESVFLFETLLIYNQAPCYYNVFSFGELFYGEPRPHAHYSKLSFPYFIVRGYKMNRHVFGIDDPEVIRQILQQLENHLSKTALHHPSPE